jgi:hypothetical protein
MAERELASFSGAVTELFGSEQAKLSAEDWLHDLWAIHDLQNDDWQTNDLQIDDPPASTRQLRHLTVKAAARLASRVNVSCEGLAVH